MMIINYKWIFDILALNTLTLWNIQKIKYILDWSENIPASLRHPRGTILDTTIERPRDLLGEFYRGRRVTPTPPVSDCEGGLPAPSIMPTKTFGFERKLAYDLSRRGLFIPDVVGDISFSALGVIPFLEVFANSLFPPTLCAFLSFSLDGIHSPLLYLF